MGWWSAAVGPAGCPPHPAQPPGLPTTTARTPANPCGAGTSEPATPACTTLTHWPGVCTHPTPAPWQAPDSDGHPPPAQGRWGVEGRQDGCAGVWNVGVGGRVACSGECGSSGSPLCGCEWLWLWALVGVVVVMCPLSIATPACRSGGRPSRQRVKPPAPRAPLAGGLHCPTRLPWRPSVGRALALCGMECQYQGYRTEFQCVAII